MMNVVKNILETFEIEGTILNGHAIKAFELFKKEKLSDKHLGYLFSILGSVDEQTINIKALTTKL